MRKLIAARLTGIGVDQLYRTFDIRQGLPAQLTDDAPVDASYIGVNNSARAPFSISASQTKICWPGNSAASPFWHADITENNILSNPQLIGSTPAVPTNCAISDDFYVAAYSGGFTVWNSSDGTVAFSATGLTGAPQVEFSPDESFLAYGCQSGNRLRIYSTSDWSYVEPSIAAGSGTLNKISWAPNSSELAVSSSATPYLVRVGVDGTVLLASTSATTGYGVNSISYTPDSSRLVVCSSAPQVASRIISVALDGSDVTPLSSAYTLSSPRSVVLDSDGIGYFYHAGNLLDPDGFVFNICKFNYNSMDGVDSIGPSQRAVKGLTNSSYSGDIFLVNQDTGRLPGTVRDIDNQPAERDVYAFDSTSKKLVAKTASDAGGDFELLLPNTNVVDVVVSAAPGDNLNDLYYARSVPLPG